MEVKTIEDMVYDFDWISNGWASRTSKAPTKEYQGKVIAVCNALKYNGFTPRSMQCTHSGLIQCKYTSKFGRTLYITPVFDRYGEFLVSAHNLTVRPVKTVSDIIEILKG